MGTGPTATGPTATGPTGTGPSISPSSSPTLTTVQATSKSDDDVLIYIISGVAGGVLLLILGVAVVLNAFLWKKWRGAKKSLLKRVRSRRRRASVQSMQPNLMYNSREVLDASHAALSPRLTAPTFQLGKADQDKADQDNFQDHIYEELPDRPSAPPEYASVK